MATNAERQAAYRRRHLAEGERLNIIMSVSAKRQLGGTENLVDKRIETFFLGLIGVCLSQSVFAENPSWTWATIELGNGTVESDFHPAVVVQYGGSLSIQLMNPGGNMDSLHSCQRNENALACTDDSGAQYSGIIRAGNYEKCEGPETGGPFRLDEFICTPIMDPVRSFIFLYSNNELVLLQK